MWKAKKKGCQFKNVKNVKYFKISVKILENTRIRLIIKIYFKKWPPLGSATANCIDAINKIGLLPRKYSSYISLFESFAVVYKLALAVLKFERFLAEKN